MNRRQKLFYYIAITGLCLIPAQIAFFVLDPQEVIEGTAMLPPCLTVLFFDTECPGCGMGRALTLLAHGSFYESLKYNKFAGVIFMLITLVNITALVYSGCRIIVRLKDRKRLTTNRPQTQGE